MGIYIIGVVFFLSVCVYLDTRYVMYIFVDLALEVPR